MTDAEVERVDLAEARLLTRDHVTQRRRPFVRFFACEEDLSHEPPDAPLPEAVATPPGSPPLHPRR